MTIERTSAWLQLDRLNAGVCRAGLGYDGDERSYSEALLENYAGLEMLASEHCDQVAQHQAAHLLRDACERGSLPLLCAASVVFSGSPAQLDEAVRRMTPEVRQRGLSALVVTMALPDYGYFLSRLNSLAASLKVSGLRELPEYEHRRASPGCDEGETQYSDEPLVDERG